MQPMGYLGLKDGGTYNLDSTTAGKVKANPNDILGKTVAFVVNSANDGNPLVGYGAANDAIAGVVTAIEKGETGNDFLVTVKWGNTFGNISTASTATTAKEGVGVACDGKGGVVTKPEFTNAFCQALGTGKTSCLIRVL